MIDQPVFVTGLPRSGHLPILFRAAGAGSAVHGTGELGVRAALARHRKPRPTAGIRAFRARTTLIHLSRGAWRRPSGPCTELGAWIPNECGVAFRTSFRRSISPPRSRCRATRRGSTPPTSDPHTLTTAGCSKLLQWRNPRAHWLLKSPEHQSHLPTLFEVFPDARVIVTHRDPLRAQGLGHQRAGHLLLDAERPAV